MSPCLKASSLLESAAQSHFPRKMFSKSSSLSMKGCRSCGTRAAAAPRLGTGGGLPGNGGGGSSALLGMRSGRGGGMDLGMAGRSAFGGGGGGGSEEGGMGGGSRRLFMLGGSGGGGSSDAFPASPFAAFSSAWVADAQSS